MCTQKCVSWKAAAASVGSSFVAPVKPNRSLRLSLLAEAPFRPPLPADGRSASRAAGACQADDSLSVAHGTPWPPPRETSAALIPRLSKDHHPPEDAPLRLHHLASTSRPRRAPCAHQARLGGRNSLLLASSLAAPVLRTLADAQP